MPQIIHTSSVLMQHNSGLEHIVFINSFFIKALSLNDFPLPLFQQQRNRLTETQPDTLQFIMLLFTRLTAPSAGDVCSTQPKTGSSDFTRKKH